MAIIEGAILHEIFVRGGHQHVRPGLASVNLAHAVGCRSEILLDAQALNLV